MVETQQAMIDRLKERLTTSRKAGAAADTPAELAAANATSKSLLSKIAEEELKLKPLLAAKAVEDAAKTPAQIAAEAKAKVDAEAKAKADAEKLAAEKKPSETPPPAVKTAAELTIDRLNERIAASRAAGAAATTPAAKAAAVATTLALSASIAKVTKTGALSMGGMVPKFFASGGFAKGTDTVPAMLTPGEFVVKKFAVDNFGADNLKAINSGTYSGGSVYNNYDVNINVKSDANANDIARTVITEIKRIDSQRIRGNRFNG
jgi:membrane protein involved in colicin uptake